MDGYTVDEAASVLGIPQGRVWELLARGVLSGMPEGESMRVFLRDAASEEGGPGAGSATHGGSPPPAAPRAGNGNGGAHDAEMSPFRELLTEFRNLTERYGQALLALGEARGEVASLRSRVDLLETRMDLGVPATRRISTVAWELPDQPARPPAEQHESAPTAEAHAAPDIGRDLPDLPSVDVDSAITEALAAQSTAPAEAPEAPAEEQAAVDEEPQAAIQPVADVEHEVERPEPPSVEPEPALEPDAAPVDAAGPSADAHDEEREGEAAPEESDGRERHRRASGFGSFAEALARAQDPTLAQLPGAAEAVEALAELQREIAERMPQAEPGAEPEAEAEPEPDPGSEPQAIGTTEEEPAALEAIEFSMEEPAEPRLVETIHLDVIAVSEEPAAPEEAETFEPSLDEARVEEAMVGDGDAEDEAAEAHSNDAPATEDEAPEWPRAEGSSAPQPIAPPPGEDPASPYTAEVFEPDWYADDDFTWHEPMTPEAAAKEPQMDDASGPPAQIEADADAHADAGAQAETDADARVEPEEPADPHPPATTEPFGGFRAPQGEPAAIQGGSGAGSSAAEEELMWLGDEFESSSLEVAAPGWSSRPTSAERPDERPPAQPDAGIRAQALELSDQELDELASSEGWDVEEVKAIRTFLGRPDGREPTPAAPDEDDARPPRAEEFRSAAAEQAVDPAAGQAAASGQPTADDAEEDGSEEIDWLQGRRGPAANAYRRLRRLFPD